MAATKDQEQINEQDKGSEMESKTITAYKGFDKDLKCRDFQYEIGKTYTHEGGIKVCGSGFHACESPLNVFDYYPPANARFCEVELSGGMDKCESDSKLAAATITIKAELSLHQYIENAVAWIISKTKKIDATHNEDDSLIASNTGNYGAASNTGTRGAASNSGTRGAASNTGTSGAASNSGYQGAASNSGDYGAASNTGDYGAASTTGNDSTAMACGYQGKVAGSEGCALFLVERNDEYEIINVWAGIAGKEGIDPDTFYTLKDGKPVIA